MTQVKTESKHPYSELPDYPLKEVFKSLIPFYKTFSWHILLLLILSALGIIVSSLIPLSSKVIIDYVIGAKSVNSIKLFLENYGLSFNLSLLRYLFKSVTGFITLFSIIMTLYTLISIARQLCVFNLRQKLTKNISHSLFTHITNMELMFLNKFPSGYLTSRIFKDSNSAEQLVTHVFPGIISQLIRFSFGLYILFKLSSKMTWICIVVAPIYILLNFIFSKPVKQMNEKASEQRFLANSFVQSSLEGIETAKAFNLIDNFSKKFNTLLQKLINIRLKLLTINMIANYSVKGINFICLLIIIFIGIHEIKSGHISIGDYISFMSYMGYLSTPVKNLSMFHLSFQPLATALKRIHQILDDTSDSVSANTAIELQNVKQISFKNVCFTYNDKDVVIDNFSMNAIIGQPIIINWASGKGKSTIARLILGFIKPDSGEIIINEQSISNIQLKSLRNLTSYVSQETYLFNDSIRNNLLIAKPDATDSELNECLKLACASEFVTELTEGLGSIVSNRATNLSAGQRQRLSIARALLKPSSTMILDEPFANIDRKTSNKILNNIRQHFTNKIVLIFTHQKLANQIKYVTVIE